ncbi:hypothetical protein lerEdw1_012138 [Lerista edwardsae]|nr:hypothetical protein lerEdw1_012138 [Lerista edwardsae]
MAQEIDWLRSQAGVCKVNHYSPDDTKDQDRKMICFVDVSSLKKKGKGQRELNHLDLGSLEEKEVIVIKDNKRNNPNNTEGAVCLFKQGSSEELNVVGWLASDLQKYAIGFQHALTPAAGARKGGSPYTISSDKLSTSSLQKGSEEPSYVNKLCSLVVQKARQELKNTLENSSKSLMRQSSSNCSSDSKPATPNHESHDSCEEKPWSMDLHAKDIFGMALKMIQQHLLEKSRQSSQEINASSPSYTKREPSYERVGQNQAHKLSGTGCSPEPNQEQPKATISGILLSLVQKVLRDAASSLEEGLCDANRAHKQAPTS